MSGQEVFEIFDIGNGGKQIACSLVEAIHAIILNSLATSPVEVR